MGDDGGLGNVDPALAGVLGYRVERAEVPAAVVLHGRQLPIDVAVLRIGAELGAIASERLVDQEFPDRHRGTVDRRRPRRRDADVGHVVDVGLGRLDLHVGEGDVEPADLLQRCGVVDDLQTLEVVDHVDQWLAHHVAFAR